MQKPIFLIGNGFNFLIADILKKQIETDELFCGADSNLIQTEKDIREITALWKKFDDLFEELSKEYPLSQEELLKMIHSVIDFFSNFEGLLKFFSDKEEYRKYREYLEKLKKLMNKVLLEKIIAISEEFRQHEEKAGYKNIKKLFPDFGEEFRKILSELTKEKQYQYLNQILNQELLAENLKSSLPTIEELELELLDEKEGEK
jgi:hypothetical protein